MSKIFGIALAATMALVSIPASAAPVDKGTAVYNSQGWVIGQDPDAFIRLMLLREEPGKRAE